MNITDATTARQGGTGSYTVQQAAKLLRVNRQTVYRMISAGQLPTLGRQRLRVPEAALEELLHLQALEILEDLEDLRASLLQLRQGGAE